MPKKSPKKKGRSNSNFTFETILKILKTAIWIVLVYKDHGPW